MGELPEPVQGPGCVRTLLVDAEALPAKLVAQIKAGKVDLDDPATTLGAPGGDLFTAAALPRGRPALARLSASIAFRYVRRRTAR